MLSPMAMSLSPLFTSKNVDLKEGEMVVELNLQKIASFLFLFFFFFGSR